MNRWPLAWLAVLAAAPAVAAQEALGLSFGPNLLLSLRPDGPVPDRSAFIALLTAGRPDRGMPRAATLGVTPAQFDGLYAYLSGRSAGRLLGGRPARRTP